MILLFHLFVLATYGNDDFVNVTETSTSVDLSVQSSVWPDLAKLCHFATLAKYSESWAILRVYLLFAKILDQLEANFHWRANGQMLKNNLVITLTIISLIFIVLLCLPLSLFSFFPSGRKNVVKSHCSTSTSTRTIRAQVVTNVFQPQPLASTIRQNFCQLVKIDPILAKAPISDKTIAAFWCKYNLVKGK